jgi:transposase
VDIRSLGVLALGRMEVRMPKSRPPYSPEFRAEAVRLVCREGGTIAGVASDLGCSAESLRHWIKQADLDHGRRSDGMTSEEREELTRLRRRVRILEQEREILKKAAAWFAKESGSIP